MIVDELRHAFTPGAANYAFAVQEEDIEVAECLVRRPSLHYEEDFQRIVDMYNLQCPSNWEEASEMYASILDLAYAN